MGRPRPKRKLVSKKAMWGVAGTALFLVGVAFVPMTTRRGVNFVVKTETIPLYAKVSGFLYRDWRYRSIVADIVTAGMDPQEKALAIFRWTRANIRPFVQGKDGPVYDDHVLDIIIRGVALRDQMNDVFITLLAYAGLEANSHQVVLGPGQRLRLSAVRWDGQWHLFDPYYGNLFMATPNRVATVQELQDHSELIAEAPHRPAIGGKPYEAFFANLGERDWSNGFTRGPSQMPGARLRQMLAKWVSRQ